MSQIKALVDIQDIDSQLMEIEELLGDLPRKVKELIQEEDTLITDLSTGKVRLKEIEVELHKADTLVKAHREQVDKHKDQLFLVSNNKQYDALMHEIDFLKKELDTLETQDLEFMEEKSTLEETVTTQEKSLGILTADLKERRGRLEKLLKETAEEKANLEKAREGKAKAVPENYLTEYIRVRNARRGVAVIHIQSNACGGCGAFVPPQTLAEVKSGQVLRTCDACNRFLYWKE